MLLQPFCWEPLQEGASSSWAAAGYPCWAYSCTSAAKVPRLYPSWQWQLARGSLFWLGKSRSPDRLSSVLVRAWRFHCSAGARSRSTCNTFPTNARARWVAASSLFQPLCHAANWTCERYSYSCVGPLYLGSLAAVLGAALGYIGSGMGSTEGGSIAAAHQEPASWWAAGTHLSAIPPPASRWQLVPGRCAVVRPPGSRWQSALGSNRPCPVVPPPSSRGRCERIALEPSGPRGDLLAFVGHVLLPKRQCVCSMTHSSSLISLSIFLPILLPTSIWRAWWEDL